MKRYRVTFSGQAVEDLAAIWEFIVRRESVEVADRFEQKIKQDCLGLQLAPERGVVRLPKHPDVRTIGAAKGRVTLIYRVGEQVEILRIHYAGLNHGFALSGTGTAEP